MSRTSALVAIFVAIAFVGLIFVITLGVNNAQKIGVERQQACVESGGSFVDLPNGQLCLKNVEVSG